MSRKRRPRKWTKREENFLREHYTDEDTSDIARVLRRTACAVREHAWTIGLYKSREFKAAWGRRCSESDKSKATRFKKGQEPMNKGKKLWQFMSPEAIERSKATRFKKGQRPHNVKPDGYERVKDGYLMIKVKGEPRMVRKHIWTWEQHYGKVPEGCLVTFKDGNKLNCDISNLVLRTRSENARLTCLSRSPEEWKRIMHKMQASRNETIRKDKMRIRWGLEPRTKLVKKWYAPQL